MARGAAQAPGGSLVFRSIMLAGMGAGQAVAAGWLSLIVAGRWRPGIDWIDRAGRIVGGLLILWTPFLLWGCLLAP